MKLSTRFIYWKLKWFGDKKFDKDGYKILPCKNCEKPFESWLHYGEFSYVLDDLCKACKAVEEWKNQE